MNNKQKEVLHQHRHFLTRNITWSNELANKLVSHGVITDVILKDIQNDDKGSKHGKKAIVKLLEVLPLRGTAVFEKFCETLYMNGYPFIADFLKDEESSNVEVHDLKEMYKRLPVLEKVLKDHDRKLLEAFINEKVKESHLKGVWSNEDIAKEKNKAIEAKQRQLEDAFENEDNLKAKSNEITALERKLEESRNEVTELKSKLGFMGSKLKESEDKFKNDFGVQIKFSMANEHALSKMQERCERSENVLKNIENKLKNTIEVPQRNSERDQMSILDFPFVFLEKDFDVLRSRYKFLLETEKQYDQLLHERNYILAHLGSSSANEKQSLLNAYRDFAVKTDEDLMTMRDQLQKHSHIIEGQQETIHNLNKEVDKQLEQTKHKHAGTVWQNAMMSIMRKQLHDVKHDNRVKDTRIKHFENEIAKLRSIISELESAVANDIPRVTGHTHKDDFIPDRNHFVTANQIEDVSDDESVIVTAVAKHGRNSLLPPLAGRLVNLSPDLRVRGMESLSPHRSKPKSKPTWNVPKIAAPEGLVTHQLKLENRGNMNGKLMNHGFGNLKTIHGKTVKY